MQRGDPSKGEQPEAASVSMDEPAKFTLGEATARPRAGMGLVVVDMQHQWCSPGVGMHEGVDQNVYFFGRIEGVCKGIRQLQDCFRQQGNEVMFVTIGSVTKDGREMSADFKKGVHDKMLQDKQTASDSIVRVWFAGSHM